MKLCRKCQEWKSESEFYKNSRGGCKKCIQASHKAWRLEKYPPREKQKLPDGLKYCGRCRQVKSVNKFYRDKSKSDGYHHHCKECSDEIKRVRLGRVKTNKVLSPKGYRKCGRCNLSKPIDDFESKTRCKDCANIRRQELEDIRKSSKERRQIYIREWKKNPDYQAKQKAYRVGYNQREDVKAKNRKYNLEYRNHPENQAKARAKTIQWRKENVSQARYQQQVKRVRKLNAKGSHTFEQWEKLLLFFDCCPCCHKQNILTVDHIIPLSKGGTNYIDNLQPLCRSCNSSKNAYLIIDYRPREVREWAYLETYGILDCTESQTVL